VTRNYTSSTTTAVHKTQKRRKLKNGCEKEERTQMGTKEKEESTQMGAMQADKARRVITS